VQAPQTKPTNRIVTLDLLRGYFLFVIIIDHLQRFPSGLDLLTGRGQLWASAAEGFFFVSGIVVALVRGRDFERSGFMGAARKLWKRAGSLYVWSIILTLLFTYVAFTIGETHAGIKSGLIGRDNFLDILWDAVSFRYVYGWADFLPHYVVFLAGAPFVLWLLKKGWIWLVIAGSLALYSFGSTSFEARWQLLFYGGMIVGHYFPRIESWYAGLRSSVRRRFALTVIGAATVTVAASAVVVHLRSYLEKMGVGFAATLDRWNDAMAPVFDKTTVPPLRMLVFLLWFAALYMLFRRFERPITRYIGWFLFPLGRNSLYVYIIHSVVLFAEALLLPATLPLIPNLLISLAVLALVWLATTRRLGMALIPR
jgi:hypothetical protein